MTQIEVFFQSSSHDVNQWLVKRNGKITVQDIKFNSYAYPDGNAYCDIMVVYTLKDNGNDTGN